MKNVLAAFVTSLACCALTTGAGIAQNTPVVITPSSGSIAPNGIGVTPAELLFSQPFCQTGGQARGVYAATNLTAGVPWTASVVFNFALPEINPTCTNNAGAENYLFISPGLGGFPAGSVYATAPIDASHDAVYKDGSLSPFINNIPDSNPGHAGITFDTVGTFGNALIVTTPSAVTGYNSSGVLQFTIPAPANVFLETATVAPVTNTACSGCLYVTSTNQNTNGTIYSVIPGGSTFTKVVDTPGIEPEGILFVPPLACKLAGTDFSYFVSAYAAGSDIDTPKGTSSGALLAYTSAQISALAGQALIPFEGNKTTPGSIWSFNSATNTFAPFSTPVPIPAASPAQYQLEGASMTACTPEAGGCPATQGFWKHHAILKAPLVIGGISYTDAQLKTILNTAPQGGNATLVLAHQLIAALANESAGAKHVGITELGMSVDTAIADAQLLLQSGLPEPGFPGSNPAGVVFPINLLDTSGASFVQSGTTLGGYFTTLANVLDAYNSALGLNCSEASGLTF